MKSDATTIPFTTFATISDNIVSKKPPNLLGTNKDELICSPVFTDMETEPNLSSESSDTTTKHPFATLRTPMMNLRSLISTFFLETAADKKD